MSDLRSAEHLGAILVIAILIAILVVAARRSPGPWLQVLAVVLLIAEVSWWVYLAAGGGEAGQRAQPLPLQLCDAAIFVAAAALWTRHQLLVEVTYFWALAGTLQAILTPDLPQHFPTYPYFQYYIAHGGVVAAALILVLGLRIYPRRWAAVKVAALTIGYAVLVGLLDVLSGADYLYLRAKPPSPTPLDLFGPWPVYVLVAALVGFVLFAILDAPFRVTRSRSRSAPLKPPR